MNDRDLETRLRDAYRAEAAKADPGALIERVHSIPAMAGRVRPRWWQRLRFGAPRSAGSGDIHVRGAKNMFAASGMTAAIAALALGGALLVSQVEPPAEGGQGAASTGESWTTITGQQDVYCSGFESRCAGTYHDMSDPRLDGDVAITFELAEDSVAGGVGNYLLAGEVVVTNEGGTWTGNWTGFTDDQGLHHIMCWFEGTGQYEGLKYIEWGNEPEGGLSVTTTGLLFDGDFPATVVPPAVTSANVG